VRSHPRLRTALLLAATAALVAAVGWRGAPRIRAWLSPSYHEIEEGLWLGGLVSAPPPGTQAVLNVSQDPDPYRAPVHRWEPIPDRPPAPSLDWLRRQVEFVAEQRRAGRQVYVHCRVGVSRSGMVVVAYLMAKHGWSYDEALRHVRARRSIVGPNPAFRPLLREWEKVVMAAAGRQPPPR
jgi:protein-tyrosine phosphatase